LSRQILDRLYSVLPRRVYRRVIRDLERMSFASLDYDKHEILMSRGVRTDSCAKEPELVAWLETTLRPGQVFYDVGANVGAFSLVAAKYHEGKVKVYAFEPSATTFPILIQNIVRNHCEEMIWPLSMPLAKEATVSMFNYRDLGVGWSTHAFGDAIDYNGSTFKPAFQQLMLSVTVDEMVGRALLPAPHHMKLDVDGLELDILSGAKNVLKGGTVESLFVEISKRFGETALVVLLEECGFTKVATYPHGETSNGVFAKRK
jgi:FkbM family methyltransferase